MAEVWTVCKSCQKNQLSEETKTLSHTGRLWPNRKGQKPLFYNLTLGYVEPFKSIFFFKHKAKLVYDRTRWRASKKNDILFVFVDSIIFFVKDTSRWSLVLYIDPWWWLRPMRCVAPNTLHFLKNYFLCIQKPRAKVKMEVSAGGRWRFWCEIIFCANRLKWFRDVPKAINLVAFIN